jgi:3-hydroxyacyl-CoA dehydrogenase
MALDCRLGCASCNHPGCAMGAGIALVAATPGHPLRLIDVRKGVTRRANRSLGKRFALAPLTRD